MKKMGIVVAVMMGLCMLSACGGRETAGYVGGVDYPDDPEEISEINKMVAEVEKDYEQKLQEHEAMVMKQDGIGDERYMEWDYDTQQKIAVIRLSAMENKQMTDEERMKILDYYDIKGQSLCWANSDYDGDVTCYAVFYMGDEFEETARYKYVNGELVDISEDEEYMFIDSIFNGQY